MMSSRCGLSWRLSSKAFEPARHRRSPQKTASRPFAWRPTSFKQFNPIAGPPKSDTAFFLGHGHSRVLLRASARIRPRRFSKSFDPSASGIMRPLRIAQVAPLFESVPPKFYGGTERVVSYLTEELVNLSQDVTLFASGDSVTKARLVAPCKNALRLNGSHAEHMSYHVLALERVFERAAQFDIMH